MSNPSIDAQRLALILNDLRLPAINLVWPDFAARADKEGWPAARLLAALAEHEIAERDRRRIERHLAEARLPPGKTLDSFAFDAVPMVSRAQVAALSSGRRLAREGRQSDSVRAAGRRKVASRGGYRLGPDRERMAGSLHPDLRSRPEASDRQTGTRARGRDRQARKVLLILDDLAYVTKDQAETSVLFELISARYEHRSLLITANQPFGEWGKIFPGQAMTLAVIDRLVHHATILEMNVDSYRRKEAIEKARGAGRPPTRATIKASS